MSVARSIPGITFPVPYNDDGTVAWPDADPTSPYYITGPALISFSGGRTSAFMLFQILWAHGGVLPDDVYVVFANTGKEKEETLRFVHECGSRWGVHIYWIEWREGRAGTEDCYEIVGLNSASRKGEPLKALIRKRKFLPNAVTRFCTGEAKIRTMKRFMLDRGHKRWLNVVGLRADERHRLMKTVVSNLTGKQQWRTACPLAVAGVIKKHVLRFWLGDNKWGRGRRYPLPQGFDLGLNEHEGNCDACMLKGFLALAHIERQHPGTLDWWIECEDEVTELGGKASGARFVTEYSYREIQRLARSSDELPGIDEAEIEDCTGEVCHLGQGEPIDDGTLAWLIDQLSKVHEMPAPRAVLPAVVADLFASEAA